MPARLDAGLLALLAKLSVVPASFIIKVIYWAGMSCMASLLICHAIGLSDLWALRVFALGLVFAGGMLFGRALHAEKQMRRPPLAPVRRMFCRSELHHEQRERPNERLH